MERLLDASGKSDSPSPLVRWRLVAGVGAILVLVAAGFGAWLWRHPMVLSERSDGYGLRTTTAPGQALWVSATAPAVRGNLVRVHIESVTPRVTRHGGAAISAWVCNNDGGVNRDGRTHLAFGSALDAEVHNYCKRLVRAEGAELLLSPVHHQQLLLRLETH
jgi:hypothetical protein